MSINTAASAKATVVVMPFMVALVAKTVSLIAAGFLLAIGFQLGNGLCRVVHHSLTIRAYAKEEQKHKEPTDATGPHTVA